MLLLLLSVLAAQSAPLPPEKVGVVSNVKVLSAKVADVSSLEAWKASWLKEGMTDSEKAMAVWKTVRTYQHQDAPPTERLQHEDTVLDAIKVFNVYGYGFCSMASAEVACLSRYAGLEARGRIINSHSVPEVKFAGDWRLLDSSLMCYFPKADGLPASVDEIIAGVKEWYEKNPGYKGDHDKLAKFMRGGGWKKGPEILARCPNYDENGWFEAATHGWYSTMAEYDGSHDGMYEYGYSQGYRVNVQLRPGERLTRNWSNKGLHVNLKGPGGAPGCLTMQTGKDSLRYTPKDGDLAPGRVGNGVHEWDVPVGKGLLHSVALSADNLDDRATVKDPKKPATLVLRMASSYVFLSGRLEYETVTPDGGTVELSMSWNHGLDWTPIMKKTSTIPGEEVYGFDDQARRRYDYRVKFELKGAGTRLTRIRFVHDVQHSQRPLPALDQGKNPITFEAGPAEGTITLEAATDGRRKGDQLVVSDLHAQVEGIGEDFFIGATGKGQITFPVSTPGDLVRLRFGLHYRARDARDGWDYLVSFDGGTSWKTAGRAAGPTPGHCTYVTFSDVPKGARSALVRFAGTSRNATGIHNFRIDADYAEPAGGFRPVKVVYRWEEGGKAMEKVLLARSAKEAWSIDCASKPRMKSFSVELAD